jgi:citrate synthase
MPSASGATRRVTKPDAVRHPLPELCETIGDDIFVRGHDLARELVGSLTFTEMLLLELRGEPAPAEHVRVVDAVLVSIMEHGLTPSALTTRLVLDAAPEALQGAVAAGLLATGSRFLGAMQEAAELLEELAREENGAARLVDQILSAGRRLPGFGHNLHAVDDPRVEALLNVAKREGVAGPFCMLHGELIETVRLTRPDLIPNAAGAIAAVLLDLGFAAGQTRGFALIARCAGLVAHASDELTSHRARAVWEANA